MENVYFDTAEYERSHGRAPRRTAYGTWLFMVDGAYVERTGEYLACKRALAAELPAGEYQLLP